MTTPIAAEGDGMQKRPQPQPIIGPVDIAAAVAMINEGLRARWPEIKGALHFYQEYGDGNPATWPQVDRDNAEADAAELFEDISGALVEALLIEVAETDQSKGSKEPKKCGHPKGGGRRRKEYLANLGPRLGTAFRGASQQQVTRNRVYSTGKRNRPIDREYGPFKDFLELVLPVLEAVRRDYFQKPEPISRDELVKRAKKLPDHRGQVLPKNDEDA